MTGHITIPTRSQLEPHLRQLLQHDPEHLRLTSALAEARQALGSPLDPRVLALLDASADALVYTSQVEARLAWEAGKALGAALVLGPMGVGARLDPRESIAGLLGDPAGDPVELALRAGVEVLQQGKS